MSNWTLWRQVFKWMSLCCKYINLWRHRGYLHFSGLSSWVARRFVWQRLDGNITFRRVRGGLLHKKFVVRKTQSGCFTVDTYHYYILMSGWLCHSLQKCRSTDLCLGCVFDLEIFVCLHLGNLGLQSYTFGFTNNM